MESNRSVLYARAAMTRLHPWVWIAGLVAAVACKPTTTATPEPTVQEPPPAADTPEPVAAEPAPIAPTTPHAFSALDLLAMDRVGDPQVSPDGKTIAYTLRRTDLEGDRGLTDIWTVPVQGGDPTRMTSHPEADFGARWSEDGTSLFFLSTRSGSSQVWRVPASGGAASQVTDAPLSVSNLSVVPGGTKLAVSIEVFVDCEDLACTVERLDSRSASQRSGRSYDRLFARHWDTLLDGRRSHLFLVGTDGAQMVDLTKGLDADVPSRPFGGSEEFTFSPDGKTAVFTARVEGSKQAWSTNFDLYAVSTSGGPFTNLTKDNPAWDTHPMFSPDGKTLVWTAMQRPGFEADRFRIKSRAWPTGATKVLTESWDRSVADMSWNAGGTGLLVTAQNLGQRSLFSIELNDPTPRELLHDGTIGSVQPANGGLVLARHDLSHPTELYLLPDGATDATAITHVNDAKVAVAKMGRAEQFQFKGARGDTVHGYVVEPVDFDPAKKYPIAFLIHGGPQGSFGNMFHYRWNAQTYAGAGYGVVMIDFHGSTGYGQKFTDAISDDWGGKPLTDLKKGLAYAQANYKWLDGDRKCALGASYGGFMINWIAGKWPDEFDCLVNHDGVFDNRIMYYATEELWFPEWEHRGPYYENPKAHEKHNPVLFVDKWKTPMLVVHGGLDYRVPPTQGLAAFTALQRRGVESKLLFFPDENHWVLRPNNSLQWHEVVFDWLGSHTQP